MAQDDIILCPFERKRVGRKNQFVFRSHDYHAEQAAKAIAKRDHPAWSRLACEYRVEAA